MNGNRHSLRGERGRFVSAPSDCGTELKRARGDRAGGRPQIRSKHKRALTKAEIATFLATLAETCNISLSARTAGRKERVFRDLKKRDPGFASEWMGALRESYDLLELEMSRRARFGTPKDVFHDGSRVAKIRVFNDGVAVRLLSLHRSSVERMRQADSAPRRDAGALFDALAARIAEMEAEQEREANQAKEAGDGAD